MQELWDDTDKADMEADNESSKETDDSQDKNRERESNQIIPKDEPDKKTCGGRPWNQQKTDVAVPRFIQSEHCEPWQSRQAGRQW